MVSLLSIPFLASLFSLLFLVHASPVALLSRAKLDVFVPTIISPNSTTVWTIGKNATVVWDTSNAPASISNGAAVVLNGHGAIANGFDLRAGSVDVLVPQVPQGNYYITLFGDSGNHSPVFTISSEA
ncbi:hypothetical protein NLJ89_g999 [Agrocybe chaxingu]|uniref:Uncharacterized protein n=1 Tax=Agrocybe chaxingu TaxID=84603 RepID=A0A9W8TF57_9AGAR|nr:hypothetical protein NLJ89_g999 [Agrocybe chaxingu]